jgi:plastocyanin
MVAAALAIAALGALMIRGAELHSQAPVPVDIRDSKYLPPSITVPVGTTVRWTNRDEETHTVTSSTGVFGSAGLDLGEDYGYTFTKPGVYPYTCDLHPFMSGTVTVN